MHDFTNRSALANALAGEITHQLDRAIQRRRRATIAVSGGNTPVELFKVLSQAELDWTRITVTLVDERWVSPDNKRSNEKLVKEKLLVGRAGFGHFTPLYVDGNSAHDAEDEVGGRINKLRHPFDVVVLGMGNDGHTASYFPDGDSLAAATDPATSLMVKAISSKSAGETRMTLTLPLITSSRFLALHIEGEDKRQTFVRALLDGEADEMPIRHVLQHREHDLNVFWAP
ncbi:MAG: 6-phosphogluconolactonase [Rhodobacteraceae bacterium]|nr:6-phosphogluconolactonase [Paracoccaceae bacterium]